MLPYNDIMNKSGTQSNKKYWHGKRMNTLDKDHAHEWVAAWKKAGRDLQQIRIEEIRTADTRAAIESLDSAFRSALLHYPPVPDSGLIEQQKLFQRLKQ